MTKKEGIRPYGPGKFNTVIDSYIYSLSLSGFSESVGDVSEIGEECTRVDGEGLLEEVKELADEAGDKLTVEEKSLLESVATGGVILMENDQGFVDVQYIRSQKSYLAEWQAVEDAVESAYATVEDYVEDEDEDEEDY